MDQTMETNANPIVPPVQTSPQPPPNMTPAVPVGVKIIAALFYIVSVFLIFGGIMLAFVGSLSFSLFGFLGLGVGLLSGIFTIAWGLLSFGAGSGLWRGKEWGQVLAITLAGLYIASGVINLVILKNATYITYIGFAIQLAIILYLLLNKKASAAFQANASKSTDIILAIVAIVVYAVIQYPQIKLETAVVKTVNTFNQNPPTKSYDQAITDSGMDCKFYDHSNKNALSTYSGNGIFSNTLYNFQLNIPQAYTMQERSGVDYCEDTFSFYKPDDTTLGILLSIAVQPAMGDYNYYYNQDYKYEKNPQQSNVQVGGQPALKITAVEGTTNTLNRIWYLIIYKGKLYTISNWKYLTDDQFNAAVASFQFVTAGATGAQSDIPANPQSQSTSNAQNTQQNPPPTNTSLPDFAVTDLKISPASLNKNQTGTVTFAIKNTGGVAMNLFEKSGYSIDYGGNETSTSDIVNSTCDSEIMQPGASCQATLSISYATAGTKTLAIIVDSAQVLSESNENNNRQQISFQVY